MIASKFTRQHYEDIAQVLHKCDQPCSESNYSYGARDMRSAITESMVVLFTDDNPSFNPDKFRTAVRDGVKNYYARR